MTTPAPATPAAEISPELVKQLRDKTSAGMMDCKKALVEAKGDLAAAETILRKKGAASASKKAGREAKEGVIGSYIHIGDKVGVLVEINCETDFVARNESFRAFVKDVTLQVAAATPLFVKRDEVPESLLAVERDVAGASVKGKPAAVVEKILAGKLDKYYSTVCLLEQTFVKDNTKTISDLLNAQDRRAGREHRHPPLHPLPGGRDAGRPCARACSSRGLAFMMQRRSMTVALFGRPATPRVRVLSGRSTKPLPARVRLAVEEQRLQSRRGDINNLPRSRRSLEPSPPKQHPNHPKPRKTFSFQEIREDRHHQCTKENVIS